MTTIFAKVKYTWIDFHCTLHKFNQAASLRAWVDERFGSAGEIPLRGKEDMVRDGGTSADALQICNAECSLV